MSSDLDPAASRNRGAPGRFWRPVVVCIAAAALVPYSSRVDRRLETAAHIKASEAEGVSQELADQFQSPLAHRVVLVIRGLPASDSDEGRQVLTRIVEEVRKDPSVSGVVSYLNWADPIFLGKEGGTFIIIGLAQAKPSIEAVIPNLRERLDGLRNEIQARYPATKLEITGETPLNFDLRKTSSDEVRDAERLVLPLTLLLLLVAFRSATAAVLPVGVGLLAISMTLGASALLAERWHLSILIQNLAAMLGLGLGIDYALLMVSQFRENLAAACSASNSADIAGRRAGHTILVSASTVAIGFAALLTVPVSDVRSIGVAGLLVAGASVSLANLLLPSLLAMLGKHIDAGRLALPRKFKRNFSNPAPDRWRQWGRRVTANSWTALLLAGVPLLLLGSQATRLEPGLPRGDWLPSQAESVRALHSLEEMDRAGIVQSLQVIVELPGGTTVRTAAGWDAIGRVSAALASDRRAGRAISLSTLAGKGKGPSFVSFMNDETRRSFLRSDGRATLIELLPASRVTPNEQIQWVQEIRQMDVTGLAGITGATIRVGGIPALNADYNFAVRDRLPSVMALVVGGTLLALLVAFRSLFAAVKAILLNLLSVAAAFGALVLVFQDGHGSGLFGISGGTGSVFPIVPILAFAIVFGLSMDYEIFLVARVLEARKSGLNERDAIVEGLARTGNVITSAAAIMVVVFAAFTLGGFLAIKMLGFTLAIAVLFDATLVRMVIGPALLYLAGDWNWWPWGLRDANAAERKGQISSSTFNPSGPAAQSTTAYRAYCGPIEIRAADEADNHGLLALTRATPMAGTISIRIDREPDFFALLRLRGKGKVFVAVREREVIGCISGAIRTAYISGIPESVAYVGDMKVHPCFSGTRIALRLIQALEAHLRSIGIDLCFSVVADGNHRAMPLFEGRLGTPRWAHLGRFLVNELVTSPLKGRSRRYCIETAEAADLSAITMLLDRFHRSRQFAPQLCQDDLASALSASRVEPFSKILVARAGGRIVATLSLRDTGEVKRNVLLGASAALRCALAVVRVAAAPLPGFCVPRIGDPLAALYVRFVACEEGHCQALQALLATARAEAFRRRFTFVVIGLHERDPLRSLVRGIPRFTFSSLALATSLTRPERLESLATGIPFEDFALV